MKQSNHEAGRIFLFYAVTITIWGYLMLGEITPRIFLVGIIFETVILYMLLSLYSSGVSSGINEE
jgi:hypothetical protein